MKSHLGIEMQSLHIITAINNMPAKLQHLSYVAKLLIWIFTMAKLEIDHGKNHFRFQNGRAKERMGTTTLVTSCQQPNQYSTVQKLISNHPNSCQQGKRRSESRAHDIWVTERLPANHFKFAKRDCRSSANQNNAPCNIISSLWSVPVPSPAAAHNGGSWTRAKKNICLLGLTNVPQRNN